MLLIVVFCIVVPTSHGTEFQDKVFRNLVRLCPGQYVGEGNTTDVNVTTKPMGCCRESFSESSRENYIVHQPNTTEFYQSCLFPSTNQFQQVQKTRSFYMIDKPPQEGCRKSEASTNASSNINFPTCNDSEIMPMRRFLPVLSRHNSLLYKSPQCAFCHGQYDVEFWQARISCPLSWTSSPFFVDLTQCDIRFVHTGSFENIRHLECFNEFFSKCPEDFSKMPFPADSDMTVDIIRQSCLLDNLPQFADFFLAKNVFCFICVYHNFIFSALPTSPCSDSFLFESGRDANPKIFTSIVDTRLIDEKSSENGVLPHGKTYCSLDINDRVCHMELCPLGQVPYGQKGCQLDSTEWFGPTFTLLILIQFDQDLEYHNETVIKELFSPRQMKPYWPEEWSVYNVYMPIIKNPNMVPVKPYTYSTLDKPYIDAIDHVYLNMVFLGKTVYPFNFLQDIQRALSRMMYLHVNNKVIKARQSFSEETIFLELKIFFSDQMKKNDSLSTKVLVKSYQLTLNDTSMELMLYKMLNSKMLNRLHVNVNRLLFCSQVQLESRNFNVSYIESVPVTLYYLKGRRFLFGGQFLAVRQTDSTMAFRICVSDLISTISSSCSPSLKQTMLMLLTLFWQSFSSH